MTFPQCVPQAVEPHVVTEEESQPQTGVAGEVEHHVAAGRTLKVHLARVYSSGRGQERESLQISAEGKTNRHISMEAAVWRSRKLSRCSLASRYL